MGHFRFNLGSGFTSVNVWIFLDNIYNNMADTINVSNVLLQLLRFF